MADLELDGPNSAISVDTLKPKTATTLTLGESGDTIALGSGATATGFTPNGVIDWQTTVKTASFTAAAGEGYFINTSSSAITVTLPSSPSAGNPISIVDYSGNAGTNNITINPNGNKFFSGTSNRILNQDRAAIAIVYVDSTQGWVVDASYLEGTGITGLPGAPTIGTATATSTTTATVAFTAPANNGDSAITSYTATSSPDGVTGTLSQAGSGTITVSGLTQNTSYTFTVTATNALGTGPASAASNSITTPNITFVAATGGTITTSGDFKIHTFTSSGTFTVTDAGGATGSNTVDYLVIAGGGGSGGSGTGGAGAGGYRESFPNPATGS